MIKESEGESERVHKGEVEALDEEIPRPKLSAARSSRVVAANDAVVGVGATAHSHTELLRLNKE
jgi:hypothetical protein